MKNLLSCFVILSILLFAGEAYAFSKLKTGLEMVTTNYLLPISRIVAGGSLILFVTLSFFRQDEYQRKIGYIIFMAVIASCGLELLDKLMRAFQ